MRSVIAYILFIPLVVSLVGCLGEEDFSFSPKDGLTFSLDTLSLDTIIAGEGTNTYYFMAYNRGKKAIRLVDVALGQGSASPFRVNVHGEFLQGGHGGNGIEILSGDSIRAFVELTAPETNQDEPQYLADVLVFTTEGGAQSSITLTASSQDVIPLRGLVIENNTVLSAKRPYQVFDSLVVAPGATLTLSPGTRLLFHSDAGLRVHGTLKAEGMLENPVVMRGDRMGKMFDQQPYDRIPGQWQGISFCAGSKDNLLEYCDIHSGMYGIKADDAEVRLSNSIIHNMMQNGIESRNAQMYVGNSQITNAGSDCVSICGGSYMFIHTTIARFYSIIGAEGGVALRFTNFKSNEKYPLNQLEFYNCLITGWANDEIMGDDCSTESEVTPFNYKFHYCLLCTPENENIQQTGCLWESDGNREGREDTRRDKNFLPVFDFDKLSFTFSLNPKSLAKDAGDADITRQTYPTDRNGVSRLHDDGPDIGCYEYVPNDKTN